MSNFLNYSFYFQGNFYTDVQDYISSLLRDIETFSEAIRSHWEVENKLHWQMDYTFKCDKNQAVNKKALFNLQFYLLHKKKSNFQQIQVC